MKFANPKQIFQYFVRAGIIKHRDEQIELSESLYNTFLTGNHKALIAESPTGTGKSLAVLVAAALYAQQKKEIKIVKNGEISDGIFESSGKTLISTPTWDLQKQYKEEFEKFITPIFKNKVKLAIIKGQTGYINKGKLINAIKETKDEKQKKQLQRMLEIAEKTNGDIEEMTSENPELSTLIDDYKIRYEDTENEKLKLYYFNKAKEQAKESDIVITNHTFFCYYNWYRMNSEIRESIFEYTTLGEEKFVFEIDALPFLVDVLVIDEAHRLERSMINALSDQIAISTIYKVVEEVIENFGKTSKKRMRAVLESIKKAIEKSSQSFYEEVIPITDNNIEKILMPFHGLYKMIQQIRQKRDYKNIPDNLKNQIFKITEVFNVVFGLYAKFLVSKGDGLKENYKKIIDEFKHLKSKKINNINVLYVRFSKEKRKPSIVILPPYISGPAFEIQKIYNSVALIGGTLRDLNGKSLEDQFAKITKYLGLTKFNIEMKVFKGYNLRERVNLFLYPDLPHPDITNFNSVEEEKYLAQHIENTKNIVMGIIKKSNKTLIITPSHFETTKWEKVLLAVNKRIEVFSYNSKSAQSLNSVISDFGKTKKAVLVTASVWEGVDISNINSVIITRIPFRSYLDPIFIARETFMQIKGVKNTLNYNFTDNLFETFIQLRQGMGRLIRKETDKGDIHLLDSRIYKYKNWKEFFEKTYNTIEVYEKKN